MNPRTTIGLVLALLVAVVVLWWARSTSSEKETAKAPAGPRALFEPPLGEVTGFEMKAGDAPACVFAMEDGKWRMTAPVEGAAESGTVSGDARKVKDLKYVRSFNKDDQERPGAELTLLDKPMRIVKLTDKDGKSYVVKIGARQKLSQKTYVQKEGDETIYLMDDDLNAELAHGLSDYRGKRVAEFNVADAVRVDVTGRETYTLVKVDGKWTLESPAKGRAEAAKVTGLLSGMSNLRAQKFVEDAPQNLRPYGLEAPAVKVAVTTETKKKRPAPATAPTTGPATAPAEPEFEIQTRTVRVAVGGVAEDKAFAKVDDPSNPAVFQVMSSALSQIAPPLDDLRDKKITAADTNRARKVTVTTGQESAELVKTGGAWKIEAASGAGQLPAEAEFAAIDGLLRAIRDLKATGFEPEELPTHGFAKPRATIVLSVEGQLEPERLTVGGPTPSQTGAYIRNDREGFIAVVKAEEADALVVEPVAFSSRALLTFVRDRASGIEVIRGGRTCSVRRAGDAWDFVAPVAGKAESTAADNILSDLSNLRGRRVVGRAADAAKFGLSTPAIQVSITVKPPPKPATAPAAPPTTEPAAPSAGPSLTTSQAVPTTEPSPATTQAAPPTQPAPATTVPAVPAEEKPAPPTVHTVMLARHEGKAYAMLAGGPTICEVDGKVLDDLEAELLETRVTSVEQSAVRRVTFGPAAGFTFEKQGEKWVLAGEASFPTDATKISDVLKMFSELKATRYVQYTGAELAKYGLDKPAVSLTVEVAQGAALVLSISGTGPDDGGRYASVSTAPGRVFVLKQEDVDKFSKQVQDFRKTG